jgi:glycosyltransferase involved in cell wall biosynthesis
VGQVILIKLFVNRFIVSTHDIETHPEDTDYYSRISKKITLKLFKKHVSVMSSSQAYLFQKYYGFKPEILQLPIINYYKAVSVQSQSHDNSNSKVRFLFFGSIQPYKGIELLLDAAEILNSKNIDFELNVLGRLRYNHKLLAARMSEIKNVNYNNKHIDYKDVYSRYLNNDVIIIPYYHVTQSGPLLIGYSRNMPCITSDLPGFREYVDDGKSGLLFNNTAEGLAEKMMEFIDNRNKINELSGYIANEIQQRFSMEALAKAYMEVFGRVIS